MNCLDKVRALWDNDTAISSHSVLVLYRLLVSSVNCAGFSGKNAPLPCFSALNESDRTGISLAKAG